MSETQTDVVLVAAEVVHGAVQCLAGLGYQRCVPLLPRLLWPGSIQLPLGHALVDLGGERVQIFITFCVGQALADLSGERVQICITFCVGGGFKSLSRFEWAMLL